MASGILSKRTARSGRASSAAGDPQPAVQRAAAAVVENLEDRTLLSSYWFVSPGGSDYNPGTINQPFKTIQRAANSAVAGDHVEIRAGVYHETVAPAHSGTSGAPIVFEAYNGESVTVSGADPITNWSGYNGSIYQASMPWSLGTGSDQVFVDGKMINYARWPNTSLDPSHPSLAQAQYVSISGSTVTIYDSSLNQSNGYWDGATLHITPGQQWIAETGTVTNSGPGWVQFNYQYIDSYEVPKAGNNYYITGTFHGLDSAGEWYNSGGTVYAAMPSSDNPAWHDVEAKHRLYAFDLSGQHDITIQNVGIFASTVNTNSSSYDTVINHVYAQYTGQFLMDANGWSVPSNTGIMLNGAYSTLENSTIAFSAGDGVYVTGYGSKVLNNTIHDVDYSAEDAAAIRSKGGGVTIEYNTIYYAGRDGISFTGQGDEISHNTITAVGLQTTEAGGIYTVNNYGGGTEIAYNNVYGFHSGGFGQSGIFTDNNSSDYLIHNNAVSDVDAALKMNFVCENDKIYNNTFVGSQYSISTIQKGDWYGTQIYNNILEGPSVVTAGASIWNNATYSASGYGAGSFSSGANGSATAPAQVTSQVGASSTPTNSNPTGSISGTFFYDSNASGTWDSGEPISPYWQVYIDANNDGKYDSGDTVVTADGNGHFAFTGLAAGQYVLRPMTAAGWTETYPTSSGAQVINVTNGQAVTNVYFGEVQATTAIARGSIGGYFFYDKNANGVWDSGESISPSWLVYIDANNDGRYDSGDTEIRANTNGYYTFGNLAAGTYIIRAETASGWTVTAPGNGGFYVANLAAGENITNANFGEYFGALAAGPTPSVPGNISGAFFYDSNANGRWDSGEASSPLWYVYIDRNNDGYYDSGDIMVRADSGGRFSFNNLSAGTYVIRAASASGWQQTNSMVISLSSGQNVTNAYIGERWG